MRLFGIWHQKIREGLNQTDYPLCATNHSKEPSLIFQASPPSDLISIKNLGCDAVFRKHQSRKTPMRNGKVIGDCDKLVTWHKPKKCPKGLSESEFVTLPSTLIVREVSYYIIIPGFRTEQVSLITTLLDPKTYPALEIVRLYGERWNAEVDLKHLKTTLGMDILRGKTPQMVRKEIYAFLLAYNLLRARQVVGWDNL